ncbi:unnamed protein product [Bursaphelenchus xylophilus]|uniref:(pine wood nematode) hypothetical protein n=1 Tax=Bursaphelenchus xylophilus TaxID=6326 RepID=A0A7I8WMS6_BURXY|nr:unnamed protein product [Bursaphelenchus xylophilus]CAG9092422.1 unnamed protein product [Bursaphelenchus xylophilus]
MSFKGKAVIVTGSSAGIGQECAVLFGEQGAFVTVHGMSIDGINTTIKRLQEAGVPDSHYEYVQGPIEDENVQNELFEKTVKKFGRVDVLVNNAGATQKPGVEASSLENFDYVLNVNLRSVISLTRKAVEYLAKTHGNIVNIGSISAEVCFPAAEHYAASKAALNSYTRNSALQYASKNIRINLVSPGSIYTNIRLRHSNKAEVDALYESRHAGIPLKRTGTGREVANVVEFLASDKASYVTGSIYVVDGGALLMKPF